MVIDLSEGGSGDVPYESFFVIHAYHYARMTGSADDGAGVKEVSENTGLGMGKTYGKTARGASSPV
jgi:hypothetical protein